MYVDENLQISDAQGLTTSTLSTSSVYTGALAPDIGAGKQLYLVFTIDTSVAAADAAKTVIFNLAVDSTADLATSVVLTLATPAYTGAVLTAGRAPIVIPVPSGIEEKYLGAYYTLSATFTSFGVSAMFCFDYQTNLTG